MANSLKSRHEFDIFLFLCYNFQAYTKNGGLKFMQNYLETKKVLEKLSLNYQKVQADYIKEKTSALEGKGFKRLSLIIKGASKELIQLGNKREALFNLEMNLSNSLRLADILFDRLCISNNSLITEEDYQKRAHIYQKVSDHLGSLLILKEEILSEEASDRILSATSALHEYMNSLLFDFNLSRLVKLEKNTDITQENSEKEDILYNQALYESVKDYHNLDEILDESLRKGYSYEIYSWLAKAFFVYSNERTDEESKKNEALKENDCYVIKNQANNDAVLDLYSKEQLIKTSKMLIKEIEKRESEKDLNSLYGVVNYLIRHK